MDLTLCYKGELSNEIYERCEVPQTYGFYFGTVLANSTVPIGGIPLFRFSLNTKDSIEVEIKKLKVNFAGPNVNKADETFFK